MAREGAHAADYLNSDEIALLERCGVSVSKTTLAFSKDPGAAELRTAWRAVSAIRRRSPKSEDWTNWLIGDWANQADSCLGLGSAERIIREEELEYHYTQHLLRLAGATLATLQWTEFAIGICCRLLEPGETGMKAGDVFSPEVVTRRRTLGQLNRSLKAHRLFVDDFEERLDRFVTNRNRFAHQLWVESPPRNRGDHTERLEMLNVRESFMLALVAEAHRIGGVFKGLFAAIGVTLAERENVKSFDQWLDEWKGDLGKFAEVQRKV
jgi:hypothetical protein